MSHFLLAVIHEQSQNINDLLAPFSEELETEPRLEYSRDEAIRYARENFRGYRDKSDDECFRLMSEGYETDEQGNIYTTDNPNSKWDWYDIGGRWDGYLRVNGEHVNSALIGEIDFSPNEEVYKDALRFWDVVVEHKQAKPDEKYFSLFGDKYYLDYYGDKETFAKRQAAFSTQAVLTPDGKWHERGNVGWFGVSDETPKESADWDELYFDRFIKNADPKLTLTIVDCHI